jgi:hypothetical protein
MALETGNPAMRTSLICALLMLAPATACFAQTAARQACSVEVDVTDTDPKGTNVRAAPGGAVVTALKNPTENGWIEVHLSAQLGDWYEIDRARLIDNDLPPDGKILFQGKGYLHKSVVGVSGMQNGGVIYRDHDMRTDLIDPHAAGDQPVELLGCWGEFLKVHVKKGTGWTKQVCTNMNTTCA